MIHSWKITYMTDYPYSDSMIVKAETEADAWNEYEKMGGYKRNEYCQIKKLK